MDRQQYLTKYAAPEQCGIEIGPWHSPMAPKRLGYNCLVLDVFDGPTLRRRARADPDIQAEAEALIEDVDIVGSSTNIAKLIEKRGELGTFDYIISSHNFEHLPDPISFLCGCEKVLRPGGVLSMAIPDRRGCFDYYRPNSTLAEFLSAYFESRQRPTQAQIFERWSLSARAIINSQEQISFPKSIDPSNIVPFETLGEAYQAWVDYQKRPDEAYVDTHCWTFTAASLELILRDLLFLGVTNLQVLEVDDYCDSEFYLYLTPISPKKMTETMKVDFYKKRRHLLQLVCDESAEQSIPHYQLQQSNSTLLSNVQVTSQRIAELEAELSALQASRSWRLTAPLRNLITLFRTNKNNETQ